MRTNPIDAVLAAAAAYVETPSGDPVLPGLYEALENAVQDWRLADSPVPAPISPDPATAVQALIIAARRVGAAGTWIIRGAQHAGLHYTHDDPAPDVWPMLELTPPHDVIVLVRIPTLPGGPDGIEFHGPNEE